MKVIWKFRLIDADEQTLSLPQDSKALSVQYQGSKLCLWVEVDTSQPPEDRIVHIFGTGQSIDIDLATLNYVGTVQEGAYVWHVYIDGGS